MIDHVKGSTEVKEDEDIEGASVREEFEEVVGLLVGDELFGNNTFQDFRQKR